MRSRSLILLTVSMTGCVVSSGTLMFASPDRYEKLAPYRAIRWREAGDEWAAEVEIDGRWTRLLKIDSRPVADIVAFSQKTFPDNWQKRFSEDLVEVLTRMKHPPGPTVDLTLQDLKTATVRVLRDVPMTHENRQAIWRARNQRRPPRPGRGDRGRETSRVQRVERIHVKTVSKKHARLFAVESEWLKPSDRSLSRAWAEEDLAELEWIIEHRYAYRDLRAVDYRDALDAIRASLGSEVPVNLLGFQISRLLALFGDGHARVSGNFLRGGFLPFLLGESGGGVVAFHSDRSALLNSRYPFVRSIDGVSIDKWIEVGEELVARGSPQFRRHHGLRMLRFVEYVRMRLACRPVASCASSWPRVVARPCGAR